MTEIFFSSAVLLSIWSIPVERVEIIRKFLKELITFYKRQKINNTKDKWKTKEEIIKDLTKEHVKQKIF